VVQASRLPDAQSKRLHRNRCRQRPKMKGERMDAAWDSQLTGFLADLSSVQDASLDLLTRKRELLVASDREGLSALGAEEERLIERLQSCLKRREELLAQAAEQGLPSKDIRSLAGALPKERRAPLTAEIQKAASQARLLQHHSLTNWMLVQRTLIHLSQMLEIIATGGHLRPTYGKDRVDSNRGTLLNQVV
jgi:uncharacterized protein with gpF-like domain